MSGGPEPKAPATTITVGWRGALFAIGLFAISIAGDVALADWLGLDLDCLEGSQRRRSAAVEIVMCSVAAGPKGWFFLAWLAAPLLLVTWWLRRSLKRLKGKAGP